MFFSVCVYQISEHTGKCYGTSQEYLVYCDGYVQSSTTKNLIFILQMS